MTSQHHGPTIPFSEELHATKYRENGEDFRACANRVACALKDDDAHYHELRDMLLDMRFMPAGRIQRAMGSSRAVTPYNCFVSGTIGDSFVHGPNSIMDMAKEAAATMRMGGGIGYDFSTLRPSKDLIAGLGSQSTGPLAFMEIFDAVCRATASAGHRRGAQMGVLRIDHPDSEAFILAKTSLGRLEGFNMSVGVTDEFMEAVEAGRTFRLRFNGRTYREADARELWEKLMRATWDYAEPGVLFLDTINRMNNLWYCEDLAATNPCAEQPLPPYGACLLGSFNLVRYVRHDPTSGRRYFDYDQLIADVPHVVRAMDNVVDRARYPLPQQQVEARSKRRMGLGVTGLANAGEALGHAYASAGFITFEESVLETINVEAYLASARLASERGSFELYDRDRYLSGEFVRTLPGHVRDAIARHGMRNSHLTSVAPTGTISLCADNVSSSIEPVFDYQFERTVIEFDGPRTEVVPDYGARVFGVRGKRARDVTAREHIDVLTTAQKYVDSACSKTCNVSGRMPWEDFKGIYVDAWRRGAKGCTTFNEHGKRAGVLVAVDDGQPTVDEGTTCEVVNGVKSCE